MWWAGCGPSSRAVKAANRGALWTIAAIADPFAGYLMRCELAQVQPILSRPISGLGPVGKFSSGRIAFGLGTVAMSGVLFA
jgi:hypothetical protein